MGICLMILQFTPFAIIYLATVAIGFGLFLVRDILAITGITIHEEGVPGEGAQFVMIVPEGLWRWDSGGRVDNS